MLVVAATALIAATVIAGAVLASGPAGADAAQPHATSVTVASDGELRHCSGSAPSAGSGR